MTGKDGMVRIPATLPPEVGALLIKVLDADDPAGHPACAVGPRRRLRVSRMRAAPRVGASHPALGRGRSDESGQPGPPLPVPSPWGPRDRLHSQARPRSAASVLQSGGGPDPGSGAPAGAGAGSGRRDAPDAPAPGGGSGRLDRRLPASGIRRELAAPSGGARSVVALMSGIGQAGAEAGGMPRCYHSLSSAT